MKLFIKMKLFIMKLFIVTAFPVKVHIKKTPEFYFKRRPSQPCSYVEVLFGQSNLSVV